LRHRAVHWNSLKYMYPNITSILLRTLLSCNILFLTLFSMEYQVFLLVNKKYSYLRLAVALKRVATDITDYKCNFIELHYTIHIFSVNTFFRDKISFISQFLECSLTDCHLGQWFSHCVCTHVWYFEFPQILGYINMVY